MIENKWCNACSRTLPVSSFYKASDKKSGLQSHCRECISSKAMAYREAHLEEVREQYRNHYRTRKEDPECRERDRKRKREYRLSNYIPHPTPKSDSYAAKQSREYREANKEHVREYELARRARRRDEARAKAAAAKRVAREQS
jgi:hypothetical protein